MNAGKMVGTVVGLLLIGAAVVVLANVVKGA